MRIGPIVGLGVDSGVGLGVGFGVGAGVGLGVGFGVGLGVGAGVGFGVGVGGTVMVTDPPLRLSANRDRLIASKVTACVPAGSLPLQANCTSFFQLTPPVRVIACVAPATLTRTQSAGEPSRLWYLTVNVIWVAVVPLPGEAAPSDRRGRARAGECGGDHGQADEHGRQPRADRTDQPGAASWDVMKRGPVSARAIRPDPRRA